MTTFRSKEDSANDQVPLHRLQERVGALLAMLHMIANRTDSESWTLLKLQVSLCKLVSLSSHFDQINLALIFEDHQEEAIDQMISDAETYEDNQGMRGIPSDEPHREEPQPEELQLGVILAEEDRQRREEEDERARQNNVRKRKQRRVRELLASLNRLSASLFATVSVAERQVAVLQDLRSLFLTSYRTKAKDHEKEYPLRQNPLMSISPTPIASENPEQMWLNTLDTVDVVVRGRKCFTKKINVLVENMEVRREIVITLISKPIARMLTTVQLYGFLRSDSERTAEAARNAIQRTEDTLERTHALLAKQAEQTETFHFLSLVATAFLPLSFCTSVYCFLSTL